MFQAGFSRMTIDPEPGVRLEGYYFERRADGVLDDLELNTAAFSFGEEKVLFLLADLCFVRARNAIHLRNEAAEAVGIPLDHVFFHCTHTHNSPVVIHDTSDPKDRAYFDELRSRIAEGAKAAFADLTPAKVGYGTTDCALSHSRRILMKDGTIRTNPGMNNPESIWEVGEVDHRMNVLRVDREGKDTLVFVNYGITPDSVGGSRISADCVGFLRKTLETCLPGTKCLFLCGLEGDVGIQPPYAEPGWFNGTERDFDDVVRGYGHSRWAGRYLAGTVLRIYDKVNYFEPDGLRAAERSIRLSANIPTRKELIEAHRIQKLHDEGRDAELGFSGMMLTTVLAEAAHKIALEKAAKTHEIPMIGISVGPVAFLGIAGEPFSGVSIALKDTKDWAAVFPVSSVNGNEGFFPMREDYDEGGFEARASFFKPGGAELMISEGRELLKELKNQ